MYRRDFLSTKLEVKWSEVVLVKAATVLTGRKCLVFILNFESTMEERGQLLAPSSLTPQKEPRYHFNRLLGGRQGRSRSFEEKWLCTPPGIEPPSGQHVVRLHTVCMQVDVRTVFSVSAYQRHEDGITLQLTDCSAVSLLSSTVLTRYTDK